MNVQRAQITEAQETDAAAFIAQLADRRVYRIGATETIALVTVVKNRAGGIVYPADPWGLGGLKKQHTHFTGALFEYNTPEVARDGFSRKNDRWCGQICIVLDDVGETKPDGTVIGVPDLEPTAIIETKPGSLQYVYAFNRVVDDPEVIETMMTSLIAAGLCDPGSGGRSRLSRLPGRVPLDKKYTARLVRADWSRRFNPDVLLEKGFKVPVIETTVGDIEYDAPVFSDETTEKGRSILDQIVDNILTAPGNTGSHIIYKQSYKAGLAVGNAEIAREEAEAAVCRAAQERTPDGVRQAKNGLRDGIKSARPIDPAFEAEKAAAKASLGAMLPPGEARKAVAKAVGVFIEDASIWHKHLAEDLADLEAENEKRSAAGEEPLDPPEPVGFLQALFTSTGVGKTHAAIAALAKVLADKPDYYVSVAVPMHKLSNELVERNTQKSHVDHSISP